MYRRKCILCQQTSLKRWFGNTIMTSQAAQRNRNNHHIPLNETHPWKCSAYAADRKPNLPIDRRTHFHVAIASVASGSCRIYPSDLSMHLSTQSVEVQKLRIVRREKSRLYPELAKIRIKKSGQTQDFYSTKKNVRNHSYLQFWKRSGLTEAYCSLFTLFKRSACLPEVAGVTFS